MSASSLGNLEGDICEVAEMSELMSAYVGDTISDLKKHRPKGGGPLPLGHQEERLIQFCVFHLDRMISQLRDKFYVELEGARK